MAEKRDREAGALCDICRKRPAALRVTVSENARRRTLSVCEQDYARLRARNASPFESLFGGAPFGEDDLLGGLFADEGVGLPSGVGRQRRPRDRESVDLGEFLSVQGEEILQQAARAAVERGARDVDSEHLLLALADNDVVQAILNRFKLSVEELKRQVDEMSPRREAKDGPAKREQVGVSPRVKGALESAFRASRDLGHSYVGPEHLLIGLAEEEGLAGDLLRRYGLTPRRSASRRCTSSARARRRGGSRRRATRPTSTSTAATSRASPGRASSTR
jgi:ATP-dependent Clp protease ATP-binding subunit ClpC